MRASPSATYTRRKGAVSSRGDVIFAVFATLSQSSLTLSDPDNSLVRIGPLPDGRKAASPRSYASGDCDGDSDLKLHGTTNAVTAAVGSSC